MGTAQGSSHHPNGVTRTLLFPPVRRRARRQAGRRAERRDCPPGGRTSPHFCSPVCKGSPTSSLFPSAAPLPGAGPRQDKPSALLAATDTKARAEKPKDAPLCPPFVLRKMLRTQGRTQDQQRVDRNREKGFKEEASGPEGTEREPVKKPAFPLSQHQAQHLKKQSFWLLGPGLAGGRGLHM